MDGTRDAAADLERVGRYQPVAELASGPLGPLSAAYVCSGAEEGRIVALRRIPLSGTPRELSQQLSRAGIIAMSIRHARLTAVLDMVLAADALTVVSEYVESASLRSVMKNAALQRTPLSPSVAVGIVCDLLRALRAARDLWREGTTGGDGARAANPHGGLLPDSVLIASFGETMLADFGISAMLARIPSILRHPGASVYRAPEQLDGKEPDEATDVYAAGVLLWEMLANRSLVAGDARGIPRLDSIERAGAPIPPMLVAIVSEAVARDPSKRFPTLDALLDALYGLARDSVATPEQVAVAVDRVVRRELDARRAAIELAVGYERLSSPPESARPTQRPPPPEAPLRVAVPGLSLDGRFSREEAPTARRSGPRSAPPRRAAAVLPRREPQPPPPALGRIVAGASMPAPAAAPVAAQPSAVVEPVFDSDDSGSGVRARASAPESDRAMRGGVALGPPSLSELEPAPRRRAIVIAVVLGLVVLGIGVLGALATKGKSEPVATEPTRSRAPASAQAPAPQPAPEPKPEPAERAAESEAPSAPVADPPTRAAPAPRGAPPTPPTRGGKPFRPRGI